MKTAKTAVSLPVSVFRDADRLARRMKKTRSQLYQDAVREYLARHDEDAVTEALNASLLEPATEDDKNAKDFIQAAARRTFERSEW